MNVLRIAQLVQKAGLSRQTIYRRLNNDPHFPKHFSIGSNSVAWDEAEVDRWLESRKQASRGTQSRIDEVIGAGLKGDRL